MHVLIGYLICFNWLPYTCFNWLPYACLGFPMKKETSSKIDSGLFNNMIQENERLRHNLTELKDQNEKVRCSLGNVFYNFLMHLIFQQTSIQAYYFVPLVMCSMVFLWTLFFNRLLFRHITLFSLYYVLWLSILSQCHHLCIICSVIKYFIPMPPSL